MKSRFLGLFVILTIVIAIHNRASAQQTIDDVVVTWNKVAIKTAIGNNARGLVMQRALAIMQTAMFDAWAQYDAVAVPTLGDPLRRPEAERTVRNKREAISYAALRVLTDLFP